jgi:(p)ppGpp synthase/HD superfamily hydrolase
MYFRNLTEFEDWEGNLDALKNKLGNLNQKVSRAVELVKKHHDQPRISTEGNYNRHPLRVARILAEELNITDETSILIALCHDLAEWSKYDIALLSDEFGQDVYEGVKILTWNQQGEWSNFVDSIVNLSNKKLIAIKIADKLDNNRAVALSGNIEEKKKAKEKTLNTIMPLVERFYPEMTDSYNESLSRLV